MPNPYELKSRNQIWLDDKGKIVPATSPARKTQVEEHTYANGEVYKVRWDPASESWSDFELVEINKVIADQFEAQQKAEEAKAKEDRTRDEAKAKEDRSRADAGWVLEDRADGTYRVNKITGQFSKVEDFPAKPPTKEPFQPKPVGSSSGKKILVETAPGQFEARDNPAYEPPPPPAAPTYAPRYPEIKVIGRSAYKVDPYDASLTKVYDFPEEGPTAWDREQEDRKYDWWKQQEEGQNERRRQDAEDAMRRQRLTSAVGLSGNIAQATQAAIPYAALPGQTHFLGADLAEKMSGRIGIPYRRDDFQSQMIPFDGLQAWRLAQGALGVK